MSKKGVKNSSKFIDILDSSYAVQVWPHQIDEYLTNFKIPIIFTVLENKKNVSLSFNIVD